MRTTLIFAAPQCTAALKAIKSRHSVRCEVVAQSATATPPKFRLRLGSANIPHPDKASYGGEDAFFVSDVGGGALGVADGVGGWQESGINPAEYSAMFMAVAKEYLEGTLVAATPSAGDPASASAIPAALTSGEWMDAVPASDPVGTMEAAPPSPTPITSASDDPTAAASPSRDSEQRTSLGALAIAHELTRKPGSATACVLRLDATAGELDAANLGDSGFLLIRRGEIAFRSEVLQHFFDCPYQFGAAPEFTPATDTAEDAAVYRVQLRAGDVIVLATDGALDNVWPEDIVRLAPRTAEEVQGAADALASLAACHGADPAYDSPYASEAIAEGIELPLLEKLAKATFAGGKFQLGRLQGGKLDDVTVVMAYVEGAEQTEAAAQSTEGA